MENAQLTLADLASIKNIIEAASSRGAFKAEELTQVGSIYDKLSVFLKAAQAQQEAQAQQQAESPEAQTEQSQGEANA